MSFGARLVERMLPTLLGELRSLPPERRRALAGLLELLQHADSVMVDPPFAALFRSAAEQHDIPAELLAAMALELTVFDTAFALDGRYGLLAVPADCLPTNTPPRSLCANWGDLQKHELPAVAAVRAAVMAGAGELARLQVETGSLAQALCRYSPGRATAITGAFLLLVGRSIEGEKLATVARALRGSANADAANG